MQIKNIELFNPTPITVVCGNENVVIKKIPALATLYLYKDHPNYVLGQDENGKEVQGSNLVTALLAFSQYSNQNKSEIFDNSVIARLFDIFAEFEQEIYEVLHLCLKKDRQWIDDNMEINEIISILMAIIMQNLESSSQMIKKNQID